MERLGTIIQGQQDTRDPTVIFTDAFVARHKAHIRGVLSAVTRPTQVSVILAQHGFQERLFFSLYHVVFVVVKTGWYILSTVDCLLVLSFLHSNV